MKISRNLVSLIASLLVAVGGAFITVDGLALGGRYIGAHPVAGILFLLNGILMAVSFSRSRA